MNRTNFRVSRICLPRSIATIYLGRNTDAKRNLYTLRKPCSRVIEIEPATKNQLEALDLTHFFKARSARTYPKIHITKDY